MGLSGETLVDLLEALGYPAPSFILKQILFLEKPQRTLWMRTRARLPSF